MRITAGWNLWMLLFIRTHMDEIGGQLDIQSAPGEGTKLSVKITGGQVSGCLPAGQRVEIGKNKTVEQNETTHR
jgi:hypothetical protein